MAEVRDVYLWIGTFATVLTLVVRWAESRGVDSLDRWLAAVWTMAGFAVVGLSHYGRSCARALFGAIVRLEVRLAFESFDDVAQVVGLRRPA